jgi:solute carrier family 13 (sodium-dependent dicarboxylate transporter), member 2/3/5
MSYCAAAQRRFVAAAAMTPKTRATLAGPLLAIAAGIAAYAAGLGTPAAWTAAITALCATWWVLEPLPIPATSLIPFAAFPLVGVLGHDEVARAYGHHLILLLLGGFILSRAVEKRGAHRRIALGMVRATGGGGKRLVLGFMLASALCSMWISNTGNLATLWAERSPR